MNQRNASGRHLSDCDTPSVHRRLSSTEAREYWSLVMRHSVNSRTRATFSGSKQTLTYLHCHEHQEKRLDLHEPTVGNLSLPGSQGMTRNTTHSWRLWFSAQQPHPQLSNDSFHAGCVAATTPTADKTVITSLPPLPRSSHLTLSLRLEYVKLKKICRLARDG